MALANTTIITDDTDPAQHQELLNWISSQDTILMVIMRDSADAREGTEIASDFTLDSEENYTRHVLQIKKPDDLSDQSVEALRDVGLVTDREDLKDLKAACLGINPRKSYSRVHKHTSLVHKHTSLDDLIINDLYLEAEENSKKTPANL